MTAHVFLFGLNLDKYKLQPIFINANYLMGGKDPDTGDWLGIIGMVGIIYFMIIKICRYS